MNTDIHEGFVTARHKVGPCVLQPYSAAHAFALEACRWTPAQLDTAAGIVRFLNICRRPIGVNQLPEGFPNEGASFMLSVFGLALTIPSVKAKARAAIEDYLQDCLTGPRIDTADNGRQAKPLSGSEILLLVLKATKSHGVPYQSAWSMPLGALRCVIAHGNILDGAKIEIGDPDEDAYFAEEFRKAAEAERLAQLKQREAIN